MIAIAGIVAAIALGLAFTYLVMFWDVRDAERRCANARVEAQLHAGELAIAIADVGTYKNKATEEQRRADALDDLLAEHAAAGPVAGSYERLLEKWRSARKGPDATGGAGSSAVSAPPAAGGTVSGSGLIKPGDV